MKKSKKKNNVAFKLRFISKQNEKINVSSIYL